MFFKSISAALLLLHKKISGPKKNKVFFENWCLGLKSHPPPPPRRFCRFHILIGNRPPWHLTLVINTSRARFWLHTARTTTTPTPTPTLIWMFSLRRITGCSCTTSMLSAGLIRRSATTALAPLVMVVVAVVAVVAVVLN